MKVDLYAIATLWRNHGWDNVGDLDTFFHILTLLVALEKQRQENIAIEQIREVITSDVGLVGWLISLKLVQAGTSSS